MAHQRQVGEVKTAEERATEKQRQKEMKKALTTTNFVLGDAPTEYASTNREAMAAANEFKGYKKIAMNNDLKEAIKKSSLHFGNEVVDYTTVQREATKARKSDVDWNKQKEEKDCPEGGRDTGAGSSILLLPPLPLLLTLSVFLLLS